MNTQLKHPSLFGRSFDPEFVEIFRECLDKLIFCGFDFTFNCNVKECEVEICFDNVGTRVRFVIRIYCDRHPCKFTASRYLYNKRVDAIGFDFFSVVSDSGSYYSLKDYQLTDMVIFFSKILDF